MQTGLITPEICDEFAAAKKEFNVRFRNYYEAIDDRLGPG